MKKYNLILLLIGFIIIIFSGCTSVVGTYQLKHPKHKLILLSNGEVETMPPAVKESEGYTKWDLDEDGFIDIIFCYSRTLESDFKTESRMHLYALLMADKNYATIDRRGLGKITTPSIQGIRIKKEKDKITYSDLTLSELKEKLPKMNKEGLSLRLEPASNIKMNDIYTLLTVLNDLGYKRAFVQIYRKDGKEIKSKGFLIDFERWNKLLEGISLPSESEIDFFKELK